MDRKISSGLYKFEIGQKVRLKSNHDHAIGFNVPRSVVGVIIAIVPGRTIAGTIKGYEIEVQWGGIRRTWVKREDIEIVPNQQ